MAPLKNRLISYDGCLKYGTYPEALKAISDNAHTHKQMSLYETASRIGGLFVSNAANYSPMAFIENEDFYYDEQGLMVLTASYLKKRGHCCHSDCRHCPYTESSEDNIPPEFNLSKEEDPYEKYIQMADEDQSDKSKDE